MRKMALLLCLLAGHSLVFADGHPLPLWQLDGEHNRIYLLGSVHLLREQDYPIPTAIYAAYDDAETLIMELDMDDLDPAASQQVITRLGVIEGERTLADLLGPEHYAEAQRIADTLGVPLGLLNKNEPWLAAISIEQMMLQRTGFNPQFGIENHLLEKAVKDRKDVLGLEEFEQQLSYLDSLSPPAQRSLLLETLKEAGDIEPMMDALTNAWRNGDLNFLESETLAQMQAFPELYEALVVARNRDWTRQITDLLDDRQDYLIVVGALHLVGEDGVPNLLARRGNTIRQVRQPD